jgi:SnoaL-like domain
MVTLMAEAAPARAMGSRAMNEQTDRTAIYELVQRERSARDLERWDEMAAYYNVDSDVDISWFRGNGAAFVAASKKMVTTSLRSFHEMGPTVVTIEGKRALAETGCAIHLIGKIGDIEVDVTGQARIYSRVERKSDEWLLSGLRVLYISDCMVPLDPTRSPKLDPARLIQYRASYRFISYLLAENGHTSRTDLPGTDQRESVEALWKAEEQWLNLTSIS